MAVHARRPSAALRLLKSVSTLSSSVGARYAAQVGTTAAAAAGGTAVVVLGGGDGGSGQSDADAPRLSRPERGVAPHNSSMGRFAVLSRRA